MRPMEHPTVSQPAAVADTDEPVADTDEPVADTDDRDIPHFRSLITPGLMSVPPVPAWLRKLFRRRDARRHTRSA
jgi:hypothetical protein